MKKLLNGLFNVGLPDFGEIIDAAFDQVKEGFILYSIIGLLVAIIVLLLINLVGKWKPTTRLFKFFNAINFVYFPVLFALVFGSFGGLSFGKKYAVSQIHDGVVPSLQVVFPTFQLYLGMNDGKQDLETAVLDFANTIQITTSSNDWIEQQKVAVANKEIPKMIYRGVQAMVDTEREQKGIGSNKSDLQVAKEMTFLKIDSGFWTVAEEKLVDSTSSHFTTKFFWWSILSLLLSSFLILQIVILKVVK